MADNEVSTTRRRVNEQNGAIDNNNNVTASTNTNAESAEPVVQREYGFYSLPPVSSFLVLFQIVLYIFCERLGIKSEEDIFISWEKVVQDGEVWRLFVAHFYHSGRCHAFLNLVTLLAIGRYLEKKIKWIPMLLLIELMGIVSNVFYMLISHFACGNPAHLSTYGFSHILYAHRILLAYTQDPRNYEPNLFLGMYPVYLSIAWAPWQPLLEVAMLKLVVDEMNVAGHIGGIFAGFLSAFLLYCFPHEWVLKSHHTITNPFNYFMKANIVRFNVAFALKMVQIFSKDACNNKGPTLVLGFYPVFFPPWVAPWEPFVEGVVCDLIFKDHCVARHLSGIFAGLIFLLLDKAFHEAIVVPSRVSLCTTENDPASIEEINETSQSEALKLMSEISLTTSDETPASGAKSEIHASSASILDQDDSNSTMPSASLHAQVSSNPTCLAEPEQLAFFSRVSKSSPHFHAE